ncbi:MAG: holo-ACP synthase [Gemmatimonadota bacterium]|nr:MAG: holo-ACP synthase [Gemmatimonadota bacterium]
MIVGIGLDVLESARMSRALERHGERFAARVFTAGERADCRGRNDMAQAYAARFAAKEACLKALGTGWSRGLFLKDVEVVRSEGGAPTLRLRGQAAERARELGARRYHVSLTHQASVAAAVVVLEA